MSAQKTFLLVPLAAWAIQPPASSTIGRDALRGKLPHGWWRLQLCLTLIYVQVAEATFSERLLLSQTSTEGWRGGDVTFFKWVIHFPLLSSGKCQFCTYKIITGLKRGWWIVSCSSELANSICMASIMDCLLSTKPLSHYVSVVGPYGFHFWVS